MTRTGYTGDRGYELWIPADGALEVWDAVFEAGEPYGLFPAGSAPSTSPASRPV